MNLGYLATERVRFIVVCLNRWRQVQSDHAELAEHYGAEMPVPKWRARLVCGSRNVDMVVTGTERRD